MSTSKLFVHGFIFSINKKDKGKNFHSENQRCKKTHFLDSSSAAGVRTWQTQCRCIRRLNQCSLTWTTSGFRKCRLRSFLGFGEKKSDCIYGRKNMSPKTGTLTTKQTTAAPPCALVLTLMESRCCLKVSSASLLGEKSFPCRLLGGKVVGTAKRPPSESPLPALEEPATKRGLGGFLKPGTEGRTMSDTYIHPLQGKGGPLGSKPEKKADNFQLPILYLVKSCLDSFDSWPYFTGTVGLLNKSTLPLFYDQERKGRTTNQDLRANRTLGHS